MENASKALIIAGAVLLSILIIAIGMAIYNGASGSVKNALGGMDATEISMFNAQYESYEGASKRGSDVKAMINKAMADNQANKDYAGRMISIVATSITDRTNTAFTSTIAVFNSATNVEDANGAPGAAMNELQRIYDAIDSGRSYAVYLFKVQGIVHDIVILPNNSARPATNPITH